jgi:ATP synthase protein I
MSSDEGDSPMKKDAEKHARGDVRRAIERDFRAHLRREPSQKAFWQWLRVLGSVGWPIALLSVGGALLGHWLDERLNSGVRWALVLLTIGVTAGCWIAWRVVGGNQQ